MTAPSVEVGHHIIGQLFTPIGKALDGFKTDESMMLSIGVSLILTIADSVARAMTPGDDGSKPHLLDILCLAIEAIDEDRIHVKLIRKDGTAK